MKFAMKLSPKNKMAKVSCQISCIVSKLKFPPNFSLHSRWSACCGSHINGQGVRPSAGFGNILMQNRFCGYKNNKSCSTIC